MHTYTDTHSEVPAGQITRNAHIHTKKRAHSPPALEKECMLALEVP